MGNQYATTEREGKGSWNLEIPFQYAWAEGSLHKVELASRDSESFLEEEHDSLCRARLRERECEEGRRLELQDAWQMHASCPYCRAGQDQVLRAGNWAYIHDWEQDEVEASSLEETKSSSIFRSRIQDIDACTGIENPLNVEFVRNALVHWGSHGHLGLKSNPASWNAANVYGLNVFALNKASIHQLSLALDEVPPLSRTVGLEGYFGGLYRCAHCGGMFAVVYLDEESPSKLGRRKLHDKVVKALRSLIDETKHLRDSSSASSGEPGVIPTMSVEVMVEEGLVELRTNIAGRRHSLDFDTKRGTILLDGSSYVHHEFQLHDLLMHPMVRSGIFNVMELVDLLNRVLPFLPEGIAFFKGKFLGERNLLLLIAANRFRGYPVEFYEALGGLNHFHRVYPLGSGLPRDCSDLPELYRMTGLPEKKSLKRTLFNRPLVLHGLLQEPDLPFRNIDILRRFFECRNVLSLIECVNHTEHSCAGWRRVASSKGEDYLLNVFLQKSLSDISAISRLFESIYNEPTSIELEEIFDLSSQDFARYRVCADWQRDHRGLDIDEPFPYEFDQRSLEWELDGYSFSLPESPRDLVVAASDLSNCLDSYVGRMRDATGSTIVLVKKDELVVGAIEVTPDKTVKQALAMFNGPIEASGSLNNAFRQWVNAKGLTMGDDALARARD